MGLTKILRSSCRQKILKALSENKEVNMMRLVRIVNSTYNEVDRNLRILESVGLITQQRFRRKRIIRLNLENKKTLAVLKALKILEAPIDTKQSRKRKVNLGNSPKEMTAASVSNII